MVKKCSSQLESVSPEEGEEKAVEQWGGEKQRVLLDRWRRGSQRALPGDGRFSVRSSAEPASRKGRWDKVYSDFTVKQHYFPRACFRKTGSWEWGLTGQEGVPGRLAGRGCGTEQRSRSTAPVRMVRGDDVSSDCHAAPGCHLDGRRNQVS